MNMFTNSKKTKKFILVLVCLLLFNFCFPRKSEAALELEDFPAIPAQIFFFAEKGILKFLNDIFTNDAHKTNTTVENDEYEAESYQVYLTPENIIKGKFILFDANIFRNIQSGSKYYDDGAFEGAINSGKESLRNIIAGWYYALRNFAIVALLSVLVYVGIRMILSTVAQDKAKYKVMFKDWLVALCLLVVMHYIMIGILNISSMVTDALGEGKNANTLGKLTERISGVLSESSSTNEDGGEDWFDRHYSYTDDEGTYDLGDAYAFILVLGGIILYTFIFAIKYLKREFTIIFLILLGPISCITYPIDKISDGKAQAFNKWLTEFLYQVIIQPFHLLLYIVLIGSAAELADKNVIYALVCFAVMIPAEKFIKSMFGFKEQLGSPIGAFAGGALASKAINALTSKGKGSSSGGKDDGGDNNSTPNELPPRTVDKRGLVDGNAPEEGENDNSPHTVDTAEEGEDTSPIDTVDTPEEGEDTSPIDTVDTAEEGEDTSPLDTVNNPENTEENQQSKWDKIKKGVGKVRAVNNQRMSKKWGSTSKGQRWKRRIIKGAKAGIKGALKGGAIGLVGTTAIAGALMTGNGKEALGMAGGIAAYAGKKAISGGKKVIKGAKGAAGDYFNAFRDNMAGHVPFVKSKEEKALNDFKADKKQMDKAVLSYRKNHKGQDPGYKDLENEMEDRFALSRYGLSDDQIDDAIGKYQKLKDPKKGGLSEQDALNQTVYAAKLADDYSKKDFRSEKTMQEAVDTISEEFQSYGVPKEIADQNAEKYLRQAAEIKGVEIALPSRRLSSSFANEMLNAKGISQPSKNQLKRAEQVHVKLKEAGYDNSQIQQISNNMNFDDNVSETEFTRKLQVYVDYEKNEKEIGAINEFLGDKTSDKEIRQEFIERMEVEKIFGLKGKGSMSKVTAIRAYEKNNGNKKNRNLAKRMIDGDVSKKELDETKIKDKSEASYYKELVDGNKEAMRTELHTYGEIKKQK